MLHAIPRGQANCLQGEQQQYNSICTLTHGKKPYIQASSHLIIRRSGCLPLSENCVRQVLQATLETADGDVAQDEHFDCT